MNYSKYFPIADYYRKIVQPLDYNHYKMKNDKMMVCPLHGDVNPSMGIITSSNGDETYHCFGCNKWGDVVDLHIKVSRRLFKKNLSEEEALRDLCRIFDVDYETLPKGKQKSADSDIQREVEISKKLESFDISDFKNMILEGKMQGKGISYFNTLMMIMCNEVKSNNSRE